MTTSTRRSSSEDTRLLERQPPSERAQAPRQTPPARSDRPIVWGALTAVGFAAAGGAAWVAYNSFTNGGKVEGGVLTGVAAFCFCTACYSLKRFVGSLTNRDIQPIVPDQNAETTKVHLQVLREINGRLNQMLSENVEIDLEEGVDDSNLEGSIGRNLLTLEEMLPDLRQQISSLQQGLERFVSGTSVGSPQVGFNSPGADSSLGGADLIAQLEALRKRAAKGQTSANSSGFSSFANSPIANGTNNASDFVRPSPIPPTSPTARVLTFGSLNDGVEVSPTPKSDKADK